MPEVRIYIIDDHPRFAKQTAEFLSAQLEYRVIGISNSGEQGLAELAKLSCDVLLIDIAMPDMNGLEVVRRFRQRNTPAKIIVMSIEDSRPYRDSALQAGADAFIAKEDLGDCVFDVIQKITAGNC